MGSIKVEKNVGGIEGLCIIEPVVHRDHRGAFVEIYNRKDMEEAGLNMEFVQENYSISYRGVLRGLHYQKNFPQGKLIRVIRGKVFDVVVDLRENSPSKGCWYGIELSDENSKQLYIPEGMAHGFLVLSGEAEMCYKCTEFYHAEDECGIVWDDPILGIKWPIREDAELIMSEKDQKWPSINQI